MEKKQQKQNIFIIDCIGAMIIQGLLLFPEASLLFSSPLDEFRKIVDLRYYYFSDGGTALNFFDDYTVGTKSSMMFVLSPDREMGYIVINSLTDDGDDNYLTPEHTPVLQQVFNSFELVEE